MKAAFGPSASVLGIGLWLCSAAIAVPVALAKPPTKAAGARLVTLPSTDNPLVSIRVLFQVGAADDPTGKEGLAALTASIMGEGGSKDRTYAEVLNALYPMAASLRTYGDKDAFVFEGTVHRDNLIAFADLLTAQILTPRFADEDFSRQRQNAIDHLTSTLRGNDDETLGKEAMATVLYKGHPYGRPTEGRVAGLRAITLDDVKAFYAHHFTRARLVVGVAGGYPEDFAKRFFAKMNALPADGPPRPRLPAPRHRAGMDVILVQKDARANAISMGHALPLTRADDDFYPLMLAASYLGEHRTFNGVLMKEMRQKRGLNYGDYAYVENFIQDGWGTFPLANIPRRQQQFSLWLRPVPPANTAFAIRHALFETDKLIREGIPAAGFEATRTFLSNYCNLWTQDGSRRLGYALDAAVYGKDVIAELKARLPRMKKADVDRAMRKYLSLKNMTIAVVTDNATALRDLLLSAQPTPIVYDTKDTPAEVMTKDQQIEKFFLPITGARTVVMPVEKMFD